MNKYLEALERIKTKIIIETEIRVNKEVGFVNPYYNDYLIIEEALEVLQILKESPFVLSKFFGNNGLKNQDKYNDKYFWGTITNENLKKVEKWLEDVN